MNDWLPDAADAGHYPYLQLSIDRLVLHKPCGCTFSLHRYAGRWLILRVTPSVHDGMLLPADRNGLNAVVFNIITGPVTQPPALDGVGTVAFDTEHNIEHRFPSLAWPSTFVLDPEGKLVAILSDEASDAFLDDLVRSKRTLQATGTIDRTDIHS